MAICYTHTQTDVRRGQSQILLHTSGRKLSLNTLSHIYSLWLTFAFSLSLFVRCSYCCLCVIFSCLSHCYRLFLPSLSRIRFRCQQQQEKHRQQQQHYCSCCSSALQHFTPHDEKKCCFDFCLAYDVFLLLLLLLFFLFGRHIIGRFASTSSPIASSYLLR